MKIQWKIPVLLFAIAVILLIAFNRFFMKAITSLSVMEVSGSDYECIDGRLVAYVVTYMLPFASLALGDVTWVVLGIIILLLMLILVFSDYVAPHPILFFQGFHFYELKIDGLASNYLVVSKKQIRNIKEIKKVSRVFEFLLIRLE